MGTSPDCSASNPTSRPAGQRACKPMESVDLRIASGQGSSRESVRAWRDCVFLGMPFALVPDHKQRCVVSVFD